MVCVSPPKNSSATLSITIERPSVISRMFSSRAVIVAADQQPVEHEPETEGAGDHDRQGGVGIDADQPPEIEDGIHGQHQQAAMGEVDDVQHAVDQRQPDGDQHIDSAGQKAVQDAREEKGGIEHVPQFLSASGLTPHPEEARRAVSKDGQQTWCSCPPFETLTAFAPQGEVFVGKFDAIRYHPEALRASAWGTPPWPRRRPRARSPRSRP